MEQKNSINATPAAIALSGLLNFIFALLKGAAAFLGNSNAMMADACESFSDVLTSFILWLGIKTSVKKADHDHPYGHGKAEPIASIAVSAFLFTISVLIAIQGFKRLKNPPLIPQGYTLLVLIFVILSKEISYRYLLKRGKNTGSIALLAEAWHNRSDALTSLIAFIGISIAISGGQKYVSADAIASIIASAIIAYNGWKIFIRGFNEIMDAAPPGELINSIKIIACHVENVKGVEKCMVRKMGMYYYVDMHLLVDGDITVRTGHSIAHNVKRAIRDAMPNIADVLVHIEPS